MRLQNGAVRKWVTEASGAGSRMLLTLTRDPNPSTHPFSLSLAPPSRVFSLLLEPSLPPHPLALQLAPPCRLPAVPISRSDGTAAPAGGAADMGRWDVSAADLRGGY
eukprot:1270467-Rhodomonas_salina.1